MDSELNHAILQGELVLMVNATRSPYDPHRLSDTMLADFTNALNDGKQWHSAAIFAAGDQTGAQTKVVEARAKLVGLLKNGYYHILSVPGDDLDEADRRDAQESYGWAQGELGDLEDVDRIEMLAGLGISAASAVVVAARYPATVTSRITTWLGVLTGNKAIANGGQRVTVIETKDAMRDVLLRRLARVRYWYCAASDSGEFNAELERIGFQRKRKPGDAQQTPLPDAAGTATWDAGARTISVPEMPAHATYGVAWRQAVGGQPEEAGVSDTPTVLASQFSPFVPGADYDIWFTGRNSRGDGPASNKIRWTAV